MEYLFSLYSEYSRNVGPFPPILEGRKEAEKGLSGTPRGAHLSLRLKFPREKQAVTNCTYCTVLKTLILLHFLLVLFLSFSSLFFYFFFSLFIVNISWPPTGL